jgi:hypothetical protein
MAWFIVLYRRICEFGIERSKARVRERLVQSVLLAAFNCKAGSCICLLKSHPESHIPIQFFMLISAFFLLQIAPIEHAYLHVGIYYFYIRIRPHKNLFSSIAYNEARYHSC